MTVTASNLVFYTSVSKSADESKISLGGAMSAKESGNIVGTQVNQLFDVVTGADSRAGFTDFRVIYCYNNADWDDDALDTDHSTFVAKDCRFYLGADTATNVDGTSNKLELHDEAGSTFSLGIGAANIAAEASTDETADPTWNPGSGAQNAVFSDIATNLNRALRRNSATADLEANYVDLAGSSGGTGGGFVPIFLKRTYNGDQNRAAAAEVGVQLFVAFDEQG